MAHSTVKNLLLLALLIYLSGCAELYNKFRYKESEYINLEIYNEFKKNKSNFYLYRDLFYRVCIKHGNDVETFSYLDNNPYSDVFHFEYHFYEDGSVEIYKIANNILIYPRISGAICSDNHNAILAYLDDGWVRILGAVR